MLIRVFLHALIKLDVIMEYAYYFSAMKTVQNPTIFVKNAKE